MENPKQKSREISKILKLFGEWIRFRRREPESRRRIEQCRFCGGVSLCNPTNDDSAMKSELQKVKNPANSRGGT
ncbi:hypothetical protein ACLOJK_038458, partial [Asimina triloba]